MAQHWKPIPATHYDELLEDLPPALMAHNGFLMGEPMIHRACRVTGQLRPAYLACLSLRGQCYEAHEPYTVDEFRALTPSEIALTLSAPPVCTTSENTHR
ncbi:MAG: hypothetical protein Q8S75_18080 [Nitrospirota bacterium]|jgi:hypothetical protein|nr:hypothetical protein [Nitrospirota bacterium]